MSQRLPLWLKIGYSGFMLVLIPAYWQEYGPQNFLWGCDIALALTLLALWREWALPASMAILVSVIPDFFWNLDFIGRLFGLDLLGVQATEYMVDASIPLFTRLLSLFHIFLVPMLLWLIYRIGYDSRALLRQSLLTWAVLPVSYLTSSKAANVNWVHGFGDLVMPWPAGWVQVLAVAILVPMLFYIPTHLLLRWLFNNNKAAGD